MSTAKLLPLRSASLADFPRLYELETASYPEDEAASDTNMQKRCKEANAFFKVLCLEGREEGRNSGGDSGSGGGDHIIGFINGTCIEGRQIYHESMSNHVPKGKTLVIHSVTIDPSFRRRGLASKMLSEYVRCMVEENNVDFILLLSKAYLIQLYTSCGFSVVRLSPVEHGREHWFELSLNLDELRYPDQLTIDAFTTTSSSLSSSGSSGLFTGNPAAVVFEQRSDDWMQKVAFENNLAETSFLRKIPDGGGNNYSLRWFTPSREVELCGHATLAAAHGLFSTGRVATSSSSSSTSSSSTSSSLSTINFHTIYSGVLTATKSEDGSIELNFPSNPVLPNSQLGEDKIAVICEAFKIDRIDVIFTGKSIYDILVEVTASAFKSAPAFPNFSLIESLGGRGLLLTCSGGRKPHNIISSESMSDSGGGGILTDPRFDFVSRCFFPCYGVNEDPFTGSAHCTLYPYWEGKKEKKGEDEKGGLSELTAYQASKRGGMAKLRFEKGSNKERVVLSGSSNTVIKSKILAV